MSILNYFPGTPRKEQVEVLLEIEAKWHDYTAFVIAAPVATGKSRIALTIARWAQDFEHTCTICPPDGILQSQYEEEFPEMASLWGGWDYYCKDQRQPCAKTKTAKKGNCKGCPQLEAQAKCKASFVRLMNPYTMLGTRKTVGYPRCLIIDEAHKMIGFQQDSLGVNLWRHKHHWPMEIKSAADLVAWIDTIEKRLKSKERQAAKKLILSKHEEVIIEKRFLPYFNRQEWCIRVVPISPREAKPVLWPRSVKKLVAMSATIGPVDVHELGWDKYHKVGYFECGSPIPPALRPVYYMPFVNMSFKNKPVSLPALAQLIQHVMANNPESGMVHATYDDAAQLRQHLTDPRILWHDQSNKQAVYQQFVREAGKGRVLVGSGLTEGVDLKGDRARWQVITKVPSLSLADPVVAAKAEKDPQWYAWQSVKGLLQALGRVCRGPDDYGKTYIFDTNFETLYRNYEHMFPTHVKDSLRW